VYDHGPIATMHEQGNLAFTNQTELVLGIIKSYSGTKGFGFISSEAVNGDVYFTKNELPLENREDKDAFIRGRSVAFQPYLGTDGRTRAGSVELVIQDGEPLIGTVKSYSEKNGYGFITSASLSVDARFQRSDLPPNMDRDDFTGRSVAFQVHATEDGKLRVSHMDFGDVTGITNHNTSHRCGLSFHEFGNPSMGVVKSYSDKNGYGFISVAGCSEDIYFGRANLPQEIQHHQEHGNFIVGCPVRFVTDIRPDGRLQALGLSFLHGSARKRSAPIGPSFGPPLKLHRTMACGRGHGIWNANNQSPNQAVKSCSDSLDGFHAGIRYNTHIQLQSPQEIMSELFSGIIKSYNANKGFGFITSQGLLGDVYFTRAELPPNAEQLHALSLCGQTVTFELVHAPDGKLRGKKVNLNLLK